MYLDGQFLSGHSKPNRFRGYTGIDQLRALSNLKGVEDMSESSETDEPGILESPHFIHECRLLVMAQAPRPIQVIQRGS